MNTLALVPNFSFYIWMLQALVAIKNLLQLRTTEGLIFKDICALDEALERMRLQLQQLMEDENQKEYAQDVEILRREVEMVFLKKLDRVSLSTDL